MIELKSFAKINLGLEITGRRPDNYHNVKTIYQTINFFDTIKIHENNSGKLQLKGSGLAGGWGKGNSLYQAFDFVSRHYAGI